MKEHILTPIYEFVRQKSPNGNISDINPELLEN